MDYEVKDVSQAPEIKKAYSDAVAKNAKRYRAVSKSGIIYGWDETMNKHVKAEIGQEWFVNPYYKEEEKPAEENYDYKTLYEEEVKKNLEKDHEIVELNKIINGLKQTNKALVLEHEELQEEFDDYKEIVQAFKNL